MFDQQKMFRVLRLIKLLADKPSYNVKQLSKLLEITEKTVYLYIRLLESIGYLVDKDCNNAYFIFEANPADPAAFEPEELQLMDELLGAVDEQLPLKQSLKKKLYMSSTLLPLAEELSDRYMAKIIRRLSVAIEEKKQVKLLRYQSSSDDLPRNRIVSPISLQRNKSQLCAYDIEKKSIRHFKVKRIEDVEVLDLASEFNEANTPIDIFGFTGEAGIFIKLQLSQLAYRLLIEEFPESRAFTFNAGNEMERPYRLLYEARSCVGIGRFILGLPGEILIEGPEELKMYLKKRVAEFTF